MKQTFIPINFTGYTNSIIVTHSNREGKDTQDTLLIRTYTMKQYKPRFINTFL